MSTRYRIVQGFLVCLTLGLGLPAGAADDLAGVSEESYADFMGNEVLDLQDLADGAEIQRRMFNRITPSGFSWLQPMFPSVAPFDAKYFDEAFLDSLLGEETNSVAVYPLSLVLDPKTRETLIYNAEGELITSVPPDGVARAWPEDADPSRVTLTLDLIPAEDVEQYLYAEDRIAGTLATYSSRSAKTPKTGGVVVMNMMVGSTNLGILDFQRLTNGNFRLTVTNGTGVAEVYSYTVWHTSSVDVATWTNEESNVITSANIIWTPTSPPFNGLENEWDLGTTNLMLTNGVGVWEDSNISSNARVRFYGVAKRADADHDGLTDGAELFVHHTSPTNRDTDADGWSDAEELVEETDPLDRFSATRLAKGVVINEVMYDASGTDIYKEWIELYSAGRYPVDLGGFVIQVGDLSFTNAYVFPSNTWIDPGTYLLLGGSQVTNRDVQVDFTMPNRFTNDATAAVRLVAESGTNILVADCLMYGGNAGNFNSNGLDTTGWISTTARSAGGGNSLYRLFAGYDTDQVLDWQWTSSPTTNSAAETPDTDGDGLSDQTEFTGSSNVWGEATNPLHADTDGDGLGDYDECIAHGTDPNTWATDGDIFPWPPTNNVASNWWGSDSYELNNGWNPLVYDENTNGIPDSWEMAFPGTNLYADADGDGVTNLFEILQNSNPYDPNSTNAQPYVLRFESSKLGWTNSGTVDVGLRGWVKVNFLGITTNVDVCLWIVEGSNAEPFTVTWSDVANGTVTVVDDQHTIATASLAPGTSPSLRMQDNGARPNYTNTLGGEYKIDVLKVEMTRPDDKVTQRYFHYYFNSASQGVCEVACKVSITPDTQDIRNQLQNKVLWSIDPISGSTLSWQNGGTGPGKGIYYGGEWEEKAVYTTLPANNGEFGIKDTTVTLTGFGCSQDGNTKIFYARNETNHPGQGAGQTPNWYFYWSQTGASYGTYEYYGPGMDGNGRSYAAFIDGQWRAWIGNAVESGTIVVNGITYSKGIDHFAFDTRHEEQHRIDFIALWGASSDKDPANDLDVDYLPDDQEANLVPNHPYSPNLSATYPDTWGYGSGWRDAEDYALLRQSCPTPGDYDAVDWSYPGNQWDPAQGDPAYTEY